MDTATKLLGEHYESEVVKHGRVNLAAKVERPFKCNKCGEHFSADYLIKNRYCHNDFGILIRV